MDYLLGVLYATKKYEALDTSRLQRSTEVSSKLLDAAGFAASQRAATAAAGVNDEADGHGDSRRDSGIPTNLARRSTARPFFSPGVGFTRRGTEVDGRNSAGSPGANSLIETLSTGDAEDAASNPVAGPLRRLSALSAAHQRDPRRLSSSLQDVGGAAATYAISPPREGGLLSPLLPGLSVSTAALSAAEGAGGLAVPAPVARPQRLEYSVPTKVLAGKYVLLYLPSPHRPGAGGQLAQLWAGTSNAVGGVAGSGGGGNAANTAACGSGTNNGGGGGGAGGVRGGAPSSGPTVMASPQIEPLKVRLGGSSAASGLLPSVSPHMMSPGVSGRPTFTSALSKSSDPLGSGAPGAGHAHNHGGGGAASAAANQPVSVATVRAAAAAATTHQRLLLFYCLLLRRLANRSAAEQPLTNAGEGEEGLGVTATPVPVAVLELHYTTEGPLRNNVVGPAAAGSSSSGTGGGGSSTADGHGNASASSASPAGGGGVAGGGGGGGPAGGAGAHAFSPSPGSSLTSLPYPTQLSAGRSSTAYPAAAAGSANAGAFAVPFTSTSAMASPRLQATGGATPRLGDASPRSIEGVGSAAGESTSHRLLTSILRHLQEGRPDTWLLPDNVVFDSDVTQNPYYGGWYSVESNDGYRRVMQLCGVQSWPAVVLLDPAGTIVTTTALNHVEEELALFTAEVEAATAKAAVARAAALEEANIAAASAAAAAAAATEALTPADSPSPPPPLMSAERGASEDGGAEDKASPPPSMPRASSVASSSGAAVASSDAARRSPPASSVSPAAPEAISAAGGDDAEARALSMPDRSSTNPLATTTEGFSPTTAVQKSGESETFTPSRARRDSGSVLTDLREPSMPFDDPGVATAEPTPLKQAPVTARYREGSAVSAIPFSEAMTPPRHDSSDDHASSPTQGYTSPSTMAQDGSHSITFAAASPASPTEPPALKKDEAQLAEGDAAAAAAPAAKVDGVPLERDAMRQTDTWAEDGDEPQDKLASFTAPRVSQLSMPTLQESRAGNVSSNSGSPSLISTTRNCTALPSWNPKAYGGDVAGVIAVHGIDSEADTPLHVASQRASTPGGGQRQSPSQPPLRRVSRLSGGAAQTASAAAAAAAAGAAPATASGATPSLEGSHSPHSVFCGGSQKSETAAVPARGSRDFIAAAYAAPMMPPTASPQLPAFASNFPWNHVIPEPIMVYTAPPLPLPREDADETEEDAASAGATASGGGGHGSVQKAFQRHLQERVAGHRRRASSALRTPRQRHGSGVLGKDDGAASANEAAPSDSAGAAPLPASTTVKNGVAAAVVMPAAMVLRQSMSAGQVEDDGSPTAVSAGGTTPRSTLVRVPTVQLELTTFAETSPLVVAERSVPMHPLRRLALCSVTVEDVAERARSAANHISGVSDDEKADQNGGATRNAAAAATGSAVSAPGASPNSAMLLSLSIGDSATDDDGIHTSRSPSPPSHTTRHCVPRPHLTLESALGQQQRLAVPSTLQDGWLHDAATKFDSSTHLLLLFGAAWHPGMPRCVRALRRLQEALHARASGGANNNNSSGGGGGGGDRLSSGGEGRVAARDGFDLDRGPAADADDQFFPALNGFNSNSVDWPAGGLDGVGSGGARLDMRGFGNFNMSEGDAVEEEGQSPLLGRASFQRGRLQSASPSGVLTMEPPPADGAGVNDAAESPQYRIQVIYISADESLQEVCSAVSSMPPSWLCLSPCVAQSATERQLQQHACDGARSLFHVTSFPRLVVVELPAAQQQRQSQSAATPATTTTESDAAPRASGAGDGGGARTPAADDEADDDAFGTCTTTTMDTTQRLYDGLWTVVQLHGEMQLNADPEGKQFPWANGQDDVLRITQDEVSALPREGPQAWTSLLGGFRLPTQKENNNSAAKAAAAASASLQQSPMLGCSCADDAEDEPSLIRSHPEMLATIDKASNSEGEEDDDSAAGGGASITRAPTPPPLSVARFFPPLKPFVVGDGELPTLLEKGGFFVVLGAFGSVDAQLHQQCVRALEEVRTWFYAEVEARKDQAWSEPTRLQVMAPHGTYATSFTVGGDRVVLSPAMAAGNAFDDYGTPTRYSPGISSAALQQVTQGASTGAASTAAALRLLHSGAGGMSTGSPGVSSAAALGASKGFGVGVGRSGTPFALEDGWPDARMHASTSPKFGAMSPPMGGGGGLSGLQLDATLSAHSLQQSLSAAMPAAGSGAANATTAAAAARALPSVFFYDSILTNPHAGHAHHHSAVVGGARMSAAAATWGSASPPSARTASAAANSPPHDTLARDVDMTVAAASSPSPAPVPHTSDNTASLRRHHAKDLALLQEYVLAPILENDEKMLPVREGEVYLALVRWPQRTAAVLRRRLASEVKATAPTNNAATASTVAGASASASSASPSASSGGGPTASPSITVSSSSSVRSASASQSPAQTQSLSDAPQRRRLGSPSPLSPALVSGGAAASQPGTQAPSVATSSASPSAGAAAAAAAVSSSPSFAAAERNSPSLTAANVHTPAATSLSATTRTEGSGKEGSPDPDATPLASAEAIKSFLYEHVLRLMLV